MKKKKSKRSSEKSGDLTQAQITQSGNSDVNVHIKINVDVKPIAFAVLYSLLAKEQLTKDEFELALKKLDEY
ncbi:hypothetical protein [Bacillus sp. ISL-78]|uniref:hypothetical protein n=1 Tax=Bacillus sp. ISL-78 TaxID=2819139 RepID=UPI001BEAFFE4|nr:hypothetical protein [Bacillus sp. ISL-78]MBT2618650.1 hypothetical protein [Bacillus sp. ISL-78]